MPNALGSFRGSQLEPVLPGDRREPLQVGRRVGRRRQVAPLGRLAGLREELVHSARGVSHQDADRLIAGGLEVLLDPGRDREERPGSRLVRLARDAVANVGLDDVDRLSAIGSPCWSPRRRLEGRRRRADSNRCPGLCRPLPNLSATAPRGSMVSPVLSSFRNDASPQRRDGRCEARPQGGRRLPGRLGPTDGAPHEVRSTSWGRAEGRRLAPFSAARRHKSSFRKELLTEPSARAAGSAGARASSCAASARPGSGSPGRRRPGRRSRPPVCRRSSARSSRSR